MTEKKLDILIVKATVSLRRLTAKLIVCECKETYCSNNVHEIL